MQIKENFKKIQCVFKGKRSTITPCNLNTSLAYPTPEAVCVFHSSLPCELIKSLSGTESILPTALLHNTHLSTSTERMRSC